MIAAERARDGRLTPLDVLARDFGLSPLAVAILFAVAAPRLRGELARLYGILANDPGRPLSTSTCSCQLLGVASARGRSRASSTPIARCAGTASSASAPATRPFAALTRRSARRALPREPAARGRARPAPARPRTSIASSRSSSCRAR